MILWFVKVMGRAVLTVVVVKKTGEGEGVSAGAAGEANSERQVQSGERCPLINSFAAADCCSFSWFRCWKDR